MDCLPGRGRFVRVEQGGTTDVGFQGLQRRSDDLQTVGEVLIGSQVRVAAHMLDPGPAYYPVGARCEGQIVNGGYHGHGYAHPLDLLAHRRAATVACASSRHQDAGIHTGVLQFLGHLSAQQLGFCHRGAHAGQGDDLGRDPANHALRLQVAQMAQR